MASAVATTELPLFARLIICGTATLGLTISEFLLSHYTHSITQLVVANHSFYNLLTLVFGATSIAVSDVLQLLDSCCCCCSPAKWSKTRLTNHEARREKSGGSCSSSSLHQRPLSISHKPQYVHTQANILLVRDKSGRKVKWHDLVT